MEYDDFRKGISVSRKVDITPKILDWWSNRFSATDTRPADLCAELVRGIPFSYQAALVSLAEVPEKVGFELYGKDDYGAFAYESARDLDFDDSSITQGFLNIRSNLRGAGHGTTFARNCYSLAQDLELSKVAVYAVEAGTYTWARAGFLPLDGEWKKDRCSVTIKKYAETLSIGPQVLARISKIANSSDPRALWRISDLDEPVPSRLYPGVTIKLGRALLAESGASWSGTISFTNHDLFEEQHKRAAAYMRLGF